jgi:hypothetical protein
MLLMDAPLQLAFPFYRPTLERLAAEAEPMPGGAQLTARWVGPRQVKDVFGSLYPHPEGPLHPRRRYIALEGPLPSAGFLDSGFVYLLRGDRIENRMLVRRGAPPGSGKFGWLHTVPLEGGWHAYVMLDDD